MNIYCLNLVLFIYFLSKIDKRSNYFIKWVLLSKIHCGIVFGGYNTIEGYWDYFQSGVVMTRATILVFVWMNVSFHFYSKLWRAKLLGSRLIIGFISHENCQTVF